MFRAVGALRHLFERWFICQHDVSLLFFWFFSLRVISENFAVFLGNYANKNKYYESFRHISIHDIIFCNSFDTDQKIVSSFSVFFFFCLFYSFFAFLSPKYFFLFFGFFFLQKAILIRCWEKYRLLINSTLRIYKTAVFSSGMQDPLASSGLSGDSIPTVNTLTWPEGRLSTEGVKQPVGPGGDGTCPEYPYRRGWGREREGDIESGVWVHLSYVFWLETLYMTVGLQTGEEDVKEPQAEQEARGGQSVSPRAPQFSPDVGPASVKQHRDGQEGEDGEQSDWKGQRAGLDLKRLPFNVPIDGCHRPGHTDPQEDVDGIAAGHIPNGRVCVCVLNRCYLTGEGVCRERSSFICFTTRCKT